MYVDACCVYVVYLVYLCRRCTFDYISFIFYFVCILSFFFFFKQKTAYEMRISDWSSDVCSSDLLAEALPQHVAEGLGPPEVEAADEAEQGATEQIGRASCRERVCQYV